MTRKKKKEKIIIKDDGTKDYLKLLSVCENSDLEIIKPLIENKENDELYEIFSDACRNKNMELILFLLERGVSPNYGIREACIYGNLELIKLLIKKGANEFSNDIEYAFECDHINICDNIEHNCYCEHMEIVKLFMEKGVNLQYYTERKHEILRDRNIEIFNKYIFWQQVIFKNLVKRQVFTLNLSYDLIYKIIEYL